MLLRILRHHPHRWTFLIRSVTFGLALLAPCLSTGDPLDDFIGYVHGDRHYYTSATALSLTVQGPSGSPAGTVTLPAHSAVVFQQDPFNQGQMYLEVERSSHVTEKVILTNEEVQKYFTGPQQTSGPGSDADHLYAAPITTSGPRNSTAPPVFRIVKDHPEISLGDRLDANRTPDKEFPGDPSDRNSYKEYIPMSFLKKGSNPNDNSGLSAVQLKETKIVNFGTPDHPNWGLVQRVSVNVIGKGPQEGWVRADELRNEGFAPPSANLNPDYEEPINSNPGRESRVCPTTNLPANLQRAAQQIENTARAKTAKDRANALELLESKLGTCLIDPKAKTPELLTKFGTYKSGTNLYDRIALNKMRSLFPKNSQGASPLIKENGQPVNEHDFIAMDTLARLVYGEMANCDNDTSDKHYMEAVAKTIINRAEAANQSDSFAGFLRGRHDSYLDQNTYPDTIVKAITAPKQYSTLNTPDESTNPGRQVSNLQQFFCPRSRFSVPAVANAWKRAMTTAIWAIMDPEDFKNHTANIKTFDYTSNLKRDAKKYALSANPTIDGATLSNHSCLMLWNEKSRPSIKTTPPVQ
jgi:hypothetical protein